MNGFPTAYPTMNYPTAYRTPKNVIWIKATATDGGYLITYCPQSIERKLDCIRINEMLKEKGLSSPF